MPSLNENKNMFLKNHFKIMRDAKTNFETNSNRDYYNNVNLNNK